MSEPEALDGAAGALLVIISGPSGVGKDTIIDALRARDPKEGGDYHYVGVCSELLRLLTDNASVTYDSELHACTEPTRTAVLFQHDLVRLNVE